MDLKRFESLSKLQLTDSERASCEKEIDEVIGYFNTLRGLDTEGVEPLVHPFDLKNVLRADEVQLSVPADEITKNAVSEDGFFTVPKAVGD